MKKFFKKIGDALKKGFQKIGKFFNSRIGKILGTVMMAWSLGSLFSSMFKGAGAAAGKAGTQAAGEAVSTTGEEIAKEAGKEAGKEATASATKKAAELATKKLGSSNPFTTSTFDATGKLVINSTDDLVNISSSLAQESAKQGAVYSSIEGATKGVAETLSNYVELPEFAKAGKTALEEGFKAEVSTDTLLNIAQDKVTEQEAFQLSTLQDAAGTTVPAETLTGQPFTAQQKNLAVALENASPRTIRQAFANPDFRTFYEQGNYENLSSVFKSPETYGASEFGSLKAAAQAGDTLLAKTGNIAKYGMEKSISEITGGRVGGFIGDRSAAATAYTGFQTIGSLLAEPPEPIRQPNYVARGIAQDFLDTGQQIVQTPLAPGVADMYQGIDYTDPQAFYNNLMNINNKANMAYAYGGGGMNPTGLYG